MISLKNQYNLNQNYKAPLIPLSFLLTLFSLLGFSLFHRVYLQRNNTWCKQEHHSGEGEKAELMPKAAELMGEGRWLSHALEAGVPEFDFQDACENVRRNSAHL